MPVCTVLSCKNKSCTKNLTHGGVSYHRFPRNEAVREKWILATGRHQNWTPSKVATICSDHFEPLHFVAKTGDRRYLHSLAIPSRNLHPLQERTVSSRGAGVKPSSSTSYVRISPLQHNNLYQAITQKPIGVISSANGIYDKNPVGNINEITSIEVEIMPENKIILCPRKSNATTSNNVNIHSQTYVDDLGVIEVMRAKIQEQDTLIRKLKMRNNRLKKRLFSLKSMEAMDEE